MYRVSFFLFLMVSLAIPCLAHANSIETASTITAVTVYNDRASVTRTIEARLEPGASTLVISGLPGNTIVDSLRVHGESTGRVEIASVEARRSFSKSFNSETEAKLRDDIQAKQDQRKMYQDQIEALDLQKTFIKSLVESQPKLMREEMEIGNLDPARWQEAWNLIQTGSSGLLKARSEAVIAQREIDKDITLLQQELSRLSTGQKQTIDAHIAVETQSGAATTLYLDYQIPGASWYALYDARLNTQRAQLRLDQLASVSQTTGEDWSNVKLTLSTHRPSVSAVFNPLDPWYLDFQQMYPSARMRDELSQREQFADMLGATLSEVMEADGNDVKRLAQYAEAVVTAAAFSAEYEIPGLVSISSERNARKFKIKDQSFATDLMVLAAPRRSTEAFLHAELTYDGVEPLLPGRVSLFRDDAFVGYSNLALLRPSEQVKLSFGVDDAVRIEYNILPEEKGTRGLIEKRNYLAREFKTTIHNHHKQDIAVRILDRLPVAQHEDIVVKISDSTTDPTETDLDDHAGVLAWDLDLKSGQEETLEFGYSLSFPADRPIQLANR